MHNEGRVTETLLREFLSEELSVDTSTIAIDAPLFSSGLVDSFSLVSLLSFLEAAGDFLIDPTDVTLENFDTIEAILSYASAQQASSLQSHVGS